MAAKVTTLRQGQAAGVALLAAALFSGVAASPGAPPSRPPIAQLPPPPANGEMGFVLNRFAPAIYEGKDDCPEGLANTVRENYLQYLAAAERTRLLLPENAKELATKWKQYALGPNNTNICANVEQFDRPPQKMFQGRVAYGLDLDGDARKMSAVGGLCAHEDFVSPDGEPGVDNQAYRALGCSRNYRGVDGTAGDIVRGFNNNLATGEHSMVLLIRRVKSLVKDDDVDIVFATTGDRPILDSQRNFITGASYAVSDNARWRNVMHGPIENGVLTTEPSDVHLTRREGYGGLRGARQEWDLRSARFRLTFQSDGSIKGLLGAYQPVRNVIEMTLVGGVGAATVAGIDCAAEYATLKKAADGLRDPTTGQCTAVSVALDVSAVPAFVNDTPPMANAARSPIAQ
jgi:hypothetical protein